MKIYNLNILIFFSVLCQTALSQILAIDFGTQYIKSAVVNFGTGKSFTIVENHKSDRKFMNSVGFYNQQRHYQQESLPKRGKFPSNCFLFNKLLIDSVVDQTLPQKIKKDLFLQYIQPNLENQLMAEFVLKGFPQDSNEVNLLEVVAMILKYSKHNAQKQFGIKIKDTILVIPNYWDIKMRAFIAQAAQIADLYLLSMISENSGAALNYALNQRSKNVTQKILFYNLGANSLQMTVAQFKQVTLEKSKPIESVFILGDYGVPYVGGLRFDKVLYDYFQQKFQAKYKRQLTKRAQIKMLDAVIDTKQVLSANKEANLFIEGLMDGIDYNEKIQRQQFEKRSQSLFNSLVSPIRKFLLENQLRPEDLTGIQLIGGSVRIPLLQKLIANQIGNSSIIGTHINGDESMVLGAAFHGANSSKKFKVKGVNLYDGFNFEVRAVLRNLDESITEDDENYFLKNVTIFKKKSRFGLNKQLNFKCKQNIIIQLYKQDQKGLQLIRSAKLPNIENVNETDFKVSITLQIDQIQTIIIKKTEIKYKKDQLTTYLQKVKKQVPKEQNNQQVAEEQQSEKQKQSDNQQKQASQQNQNKQQSQQQKSDKQDDDSDDEETKKQSKSKKSKKKKPKVQYETVQKNKTVTKTYQKQLKKIDTYTHELADHQITEKSKQMLQQYQKNEQQKKMLHQSKNKLQSLIYEIQDKLQTQEFLEFVKDSEKQKITELVTAKSAWLDDAYDSKRQQFDDHFKQLNKPISKIKKRINEFNDRQFAKQKADVELGKYVKLAENITTKKNWIEQDVVQEFFQTIQESKQQINNMLTKMNETPKSENPVYVISDFNKIIEKIKDQYFKIMATPQPKKDKKKQQKSEKQTEEQASEDEQNDEL